MSRGRIYLTALAAALTALVADQGSKWALLDWVGFMNNPTPVRVLPVFDLVLWWNHGTSFSLFEIGSAWGPYLFSLLALVIVGFLVLWLKWIVKPVLAAAIGAVIGGALGNVVDRLRFGAVADFFYAHVGEYGWPAFNIADSMIVVGVAVLVLDGMFLSHKTNDDLARRK